MAADLGIMRQLVQADKKYTEAVSVYRDIPQACSQWWIASTSLALPNSVNWKTAIAMWNKAEKASKAAMIVYLARAGHTNAIVGQVQAQFENPANGQTEVKTCPMSIVVTTKTSRKAQTYDNGKKMLEDMVAAGKIAAAVANEVLDSLYPVKLGMTVVVQPLPDTLRL